MRQNPSNLRPCLAPYTIPLLRPGMGLAIAVVFGAGRTERVLLYLDVNRTDRGTRAHPGTHSAHHAHPATLRESKKE